MNKDKASKVYLERLYDMGIRRNRDMLPEERYKLIGLLMKEEKESDREDFIIQNKLFSEFVLHFCNYLISTDGQDVDTSNFIRDEAVEALTSGVDDYCKAIINQMLTDIYAERAELEDAGYQQDEIGLVRLAH